MEKTLLFLSSRIYSQKKIFLSIWIILLIISFYILITYPSNNKETELYGATGTEAYQVEEILKNEFKVRLGSSSAIVINGKDNDSKLKNSLLEKFSEIDEIIQIYGNKEHKNTLYLIKFNPDILFVDTQSLTKDIREQVDKWKKNTGNKAYVTGNAAFYHDVKTNSQKDSASSEKIALTVAFFVLIIIFGSIFSAILPLIVGSTSIIFLNAFLTFTEIEINPMSQVLSIMVGLALAIDYSLFILSRFKEEITKNDIFESLNNTILYSGQTILFSSLIMMCSVGALYIPEVSTCRTIVINVLLVILISSINSIVFLPVILLFTKNILDKPKFMTNLIKKMDSYFFWIKYASHIVKYPKFYFLLTLIILGILSYPVLNMKLWEPVQTLTSKESESMIGYKVLEDDGWGGGELVPINLVLKTKDKTVFDKESITYIYNLTNELLKHPNVSSVQSLTSWNNNFSAEDFLTFYKSIYSLALINNQKIPLVNTDSGNNISIINVYQKDIMNVYESYELIDFIKKYKENNPNFELLVGGVVPRAKDFTNEIYRHTYLMLSIVIIGIFILLYLYMKAILLPVKAAIMNFLPIISAFGILTLVFQYGYFSDLLNTPVNGAITNIIPIILFCIVFGLSMDYEVLILSRISEKYYKTKDVKKAVTEGLAQSSSIITGAALILLGVFIPGIFSSSPAIKEISIGITASIFIDATIIRLLLVPSFMMLMGKWNWWNPFKN